MRESVVYQSIKTEGGDEKARQIAINMLIEGMSVDLIAKLTGLSVEQVQQLEQQQTQE
ncbi:MULTISPECIES: hypothetical protein [Nostoc]|uniref:Transposase n=1 Tax=Nostoc punctiforme FACHB-252 TaxID=1357509 RepID=A0ABR8HIG6_NOSPU|nr:MULTISPECIES: hypothetical protein [Nostoc]MBC1237246.1 hypothetical protein [Nostoc sp. 2RC]MBD2615645.1 hypothetical protein [Nostoc punctiforme FACHB-252]